MNGIFTISLDFELHWGGFEKWPLQNGTDINSNSHFHNQYFLNTRETIPKMLELFSKYEIHVTWAGVGMLMHKDKTSLLENLPSIQPAYSNRNLSAYNFIEQVGIGESEVDDPFHYADSLVKQILATDHQELGSHTFSHFYCNEEGQTVDEFRADLKAAQKAASSYGLRLRSLIFPRNQFNDNYLKVCYEEGFDSVRSNPNDWFWKIDSTQNESKWKRLNRGLDAYLPIGKDTSFNLMDLPVRHGHSICIPASRLLRPFNPKELFLNQWKVNRIKSEMEGAAKRGEVYHLWWHPHNFGNFPEQSLSALEKILVSFSECATSHGMRSLNMGELASLIKLANGKEEIA